MKYEVITFAIFMLLVIPLVSSTQGFFGTRVAGECVNLAQTCSTCSYENISAIEYPDGTYVINESSMTQNGIYWNFTYCFPNLIGDYWIYGHDDESGSDEEWEYKITLTYNGEKVSLSNTILPGIFIILSIILLIIGFSFSSEHWILRTFFNFAAVGIGLLSVNSAKIIANESANLGKMGTVGITIMIVIFSLFFIYIFVYAFIEIIKAFKRKEAIRWEY